MFILVSMLKALSTVDFALCDSGACVFTVPRRPLADWMVIFGVGEPRVEFAAYVCQSGHTTTGLVSKKTPSRQRHALGALLTVFAQEHAGYSMVVKV